MDHTMDHAYPEKERHKERHRGRDDVVRKHPRSSTSSSPDHPLPVSSPASGDPVARPAAGPVGQSSAVPRWVEGPVENPSGGG